MDAFTFQVSETLLLFLAHTLRSVLLTTSTRDSKDRWHNVQECLRLAATVRYGQPERELLNKFGTHLVCRMGNFGKQWSPIVIASGAG
jgi:hypothetical protein